MKWLLVIAGLVLAVRAGAQDFRGDARRIVDSIAAQWQADPAGSPAPVAGDYLVLLQDSLEKAFAAANVRRLTQNGEYTWPGWYLIPGLSGAADTPVRCSGLTETSRYLLESEYHISLQGVSNGCVWQQAFVYHDSLMAAAIRRQYGARFFDDYCQIAADLDARGKGLRLPHIRHDSLTAAQLYKAFAFVQELSSPEAGDGRGCYLLLRFEKGKVARVSVCRRVFYIQQDLALMEVSDRLTAIARALPWVPPTFRNKPADASVVYDFQGGTLAFYRGASFF